MPQLELTDRELLVRLNKWEQLWALCSDIKVPLEKVRGATEDDGFGGRSGWQLGIRLPGTHVPYFLAAGTFLKEGDRQFVYKRLGLQTIVIELSGHEWARLVIGVKDARAETSRINAFVARRQGWGGPQ